MSSSSSSPPPLSFHPPPYLLTPPSPPPSFLFFPQQPKTKSFTTPSLSLSRFPPSSATPPSRFHPTHPLLLAHMASPPLESDPCPPDRRPDEDTPPFPARPPKPHQNPPAKAPSKSKLKLLHQQERERERKSLVVQAFHDFYQAQYGDRWPSLFSALLSEPRSSCLVNCFADSRAIAQNVSQVPDLSRLPFLKLPVYESTARFPHPERDCKNVFTYYLLDAASVLATEALGVCRGETVLDLCAAPGGKSLAILQQLGLPQGTLTANEMSEERKRRLWKTLVDAPCSSERHLLHDHEQLCRWTHKRSANCAKRQLALLTAGLRSIHVGGLVVYSTCSISHLENDGVIAKVLNGMQW